MRFAGLALAVLVPYPGDILTIVTHDPVLETGGKDEVG